MAKPTPNNDIIEEILQRLPPESVLRFKAVNKTFNQLTSTPQFLASYNQRRSHLTTNTSLALFNNNNNNNNNINNNNNGRRLVVVRGRRGASCYRLPVEELRALVFGCGGLLGFTKEMEHGARLVVVNPLTGENYVRRLPPRGKTRRRRFLLFYRDPLGGGHKVLMWSMVADEVPIYTLITLKPQMAIGVEGQSWPSYWPLPLGSVVVNGRGYWVACKERTAIMYFTFATRQFGLFRMPDDFKFRDISSHMIFRLGDFFCLASIIDDTEFDYVGGIEWPLQMWVRVEDAWIRKIVVIRNSIGEEEYDVVGFYRGRVLLVQSVDVELPERECVFCWVGSDAVRELSFGTATVTHDLLGKVLYKESLERLSNQKANC